VHRIGALPGEGIGPEVVGAALDVLAALDGLGGLSLELRVGPQVASRAGWAPGRLTEAEAHFVEEVFGDGGAVLCGPRGGRFVYDLRERFDLFCELTPVRPLTVLSDTGPCRAETVRDADLVFVGESLGGLYFGSHRKHRRAGSLREASHRFGYKRRAVDRILRVAVGLALLRRGRLSLVQKSSGAPSISSLWLEAALQLAEPLGVELELLEVDNACYQVVADARHFDVVVSPSLFGDGLADVAALLLGSRGVSHSASFGEQGRAVYQTGHGAARDLAGSDRANPLGQILSLASLLEESFGLGELAAAVRTGTQAVLADGWRTPDLLAPGCTPVGTRELGKRIAERAHAAALRADEPA